MFSSTYIPNMKAFPFFIPEKKRQIGFQTKITVTHRFSCFASCQPHPFYGGKLVCVQQRQLIKSIAICGFFGGGYGPAAVGDSRSERQSAERTSSGSAPALSVSPTVTCYWSFKAVWKASVVVLSRYRFIFEFYAKNIHSFSLGRCQGWLSKRLDEGSCSDGLLLLHPQLSVQMWGSYRDA